MLGSKICVKYTTVHHPSLQDPLIRDWLEVQLCVMLFKVWDHLWAVAGILITPGSAHTCVWKAVVCFFFLPARSPTLLPFLML